MLHKKTQAKMTIFRLLGGEENDAMNMVDQQFFSRGYEEGSPMCHWFEGNVLKSGTFHLYELALFKVEEATVKEGMQEEETDDFDFD